MLLTPRERTPDLISEGIRMIKILIIGDRWWKEVNPILEYILEQYEKYGDNFVIISGGARGADKIAEAIAKGMGVFSKIPSPEIYEADWRGKGKSAGPKRNQAMINIKPDKVMAFHNNLSRSKGTIDCIRRATRAKIPVEVYPYNEDNRRILSNLGAAHVQKRLGENEEEDS